MKSPFCIIYQFTYQPSPLTGSGLRSDCVGNLMRLSLDKALAVGNQLEVEALSEC